MLFEGFIHDLKNLLPWVHIKNEQSSLRGIIEQRRRIYPRESVVNDSKLIVERLEALEAFRSAKTVLLYYPIHHEVDLRDLIHRYKDEKTILLPVTHRRKMEVRPYTGEESLKHGRHRIPEPQTATYKGAIDLIVCPGVVFDKHKHRIGRGGGYYDKFLKKHPLATKIGVCFDFQLRNRDIPQQRFDHPMSMVVTPTQTIE